MGNFWEILDYFLFQHLATLDVISEELKSQNDNIYICLPAYLTKLSLIKGRPQVSMKFMLTKLLVNQKLKLQTTTPTPPPFNVLESTDTSVKLGS